MLTILSGLYSIRLSVSNDADDEPEEMMKNENEITENEITENEKLAVFYGIMSGV